MAPPANAMEHNTNLSKVTVVGSGNWGSVAAKLIASNTLKFASFHDEVRMWVYEETLPSGEKLIDVINRTNENVKYLPGIKLGKNGIADPDLENAEWDPWGVPEDYSVNISRMMLKCQSIYIDSSTWSSP